MVFNQETAIATNGEEKPKAKVFKSQDDGGGGGFTCYKCNKEGHMARDCPTGGGDRNCFKCQQPGHVSRECPNSTGGDDRTCHNCNEKGHISRDCPTGGRRSTGGRACHNCNKEGHIARDCPTGGSGGRGRTGGGDRNCFKCQQPGHISRDCPNSTGGGGDDRTCHKCNEKGHISRDCPAGGGRGGGGRACHNCNKVGHIARECPTGGSGGRGRTGGNDRNCFKCQQPGHISRDCPNSTGGAGRACYKCNKEGHMSRECPNGSSGGGNKYINFVKGGQVTPNNGSTGEQVLDEDDSEMESDDDMPVQKIPVKKTPQAAKDDADDDDDDDDDDDEDDKEDDKVGKKEDDDEDDEDEEDDDDEDEEDDDDNNVEDSKVNQKVLKNKLSLNESIKAQNENREQDLRKKLFVKKLPLNTTPAELKALSSDILSVNLQNDKRISKNAPPSQIAFLEFANESKAEENFETLKGKQYRGACLKVSYCGKKHQQMTLNSAKKKMVYISGIPGGATIDEIVKICPKAFSFFIDLTNENQYRVAEVEFKSTDDATECYNANRNVKIGGKKVKVLYEKPYCANAENKRKRANQKDAGNAKKMKGDNIVKEEVHFDKDDDEDDDDDDEDDDEE